MNRLLKTEALLTISRRLLPGTKSYEMHGYTLTPVPCADENTSGVKLSFSSPPFEGPFPHWHPEAEVRYVADTLALCLRAVVMVNSTRSEGSPRVPGAGTPPTYPQFAGQCSFDGLEAMFERVSDLSDDMGRQFLRACHSYALALGLMPTDATFALFLLVVAVECLSNRHEVISCDELPAGSKCSRFWSFIARNVPDEFLPNANLDMKGFEDLLKHIYRSHRSGFVHGGKEVSSAMSLADSLGLPFVRHYENGRDVRTPGVAWFSEVVRRSLLQWLSSSDSTGRPAQHLNLFQRLANEKKSINLKAKRAIRAGQPVTLDDVEL